MDPKKNIAADIFDMVIVGGGPAGLTAGLYAARGRMKTLLVESFSVMGQMTMTDAVENYPGIKMIGGFEFLTALKEQAKGFGLECAQGTVQGLTFKEEDGLPIWHVRDENKTYKALSIVIASGASPMKLNIPGEQEFIGSGVSYCATCDGAFFRDKDIIVIGGGDTAVEEALFLTKFGKKVTVVHKRDRLRAIKILQERAFASDKMDFIWNSVVEEIKGDNKVEKIVVRNVKTEEVKDIACDGVFLFIGWNPNTDFAEGVLDMTEKGNILTGDNLETSSKGIFAAGDCCKKLLNQVVTACGDGATASVSAQHYVDELKGVAYK